MREAGDGVHDPLRDCSKATVKGHRSRLGFFVKWCQQQGIDNLNVISARDLESSFSRLGTVELRSRPSGSISTRGPDPAMSLASAPTTASRPIGRPRRRCGSVGRCLTRFRKKTLTDSKNPMFPYTKAGHYTPLFWLERLSQEEDI